MSEGDKNTSQTLIDGPDMIKQVDELGLRHQRLKVGIQMRREQTVEQLSVLNMRPLRGLSLSITSQCIVRKTNQTSFDQLTFPNPALCDR